MSTNLNTASNEPIFAENISKPGDPIAACFAETVDGHCVAILGDVRRSHGYTLATLELAAQDAFKCSIKPDSEIIEPLLGKGANEDYLEFLEAIKGFTDDPDAARLELNKLLEKHKPAA